MRSLRSTLSNKHSAASTPRTPEMTAVPEQSLSAVHKAPRSNGDTIPARAEHAVESSVRLVLSSGGVLTSSSGSLIKLMEL